MKKEENKSNIFFQGREFSVIESCEEIKHQLECDIKLVVLHFKDYDGSGNVTLNKIYLPKYSFIFTEYITPVLLNDDGC